MKKIYQIRFLRRSILSILERINPGDITIHHHWTGDRFTLHSFKHKGYWYHGKKRKQETMLRYSDLIGKGDFVVEIGAHIGYVSLYFAHLIGPEGQLIVFEPGPNNLPYLRKNLTSNPRISIVEKAVTDYVGSARFYVDNLTGQNSSLLEGHDALVSRNQVTHVNSSEESVIEVPCTSLDDFLLRAQLPPPSFVKIDVEGAELSVLNGMKDILGKDDIALMVEVTENAPDVFALLRDAGFHMFRPNKSPVNDSKDMRCNLFCIKGNDDRIRIFWVSRISRGQSPDPKGFRAKFGKKGCYAGKKMLFTRSWAKPLGSSHAKSQRANFLCLMGRLKGQRRRSSNFGRSRLSRILA